MLSKCKKRKSSLIILDEGIWKENVYAPADLKCTVSYYVYEINLH